MSLWIIQRDFPIIVNADLSEKEKEKLLAVLSKHRKALAIQYYM